MEIKDRITMLDDLLILNEQAGLPEPDVANLVNFLAGLPGTEREAILEFMQKGDRYNRFERFAKLANMESVQRDTILKAMGFQPVARKGFLHEFMDPLGESTTRVKQTISDMAGARKTLQEDFLEPLKLLFNFQRKKTK